MRDLSNTEWSAFAKAVKQLQSGPSPTPYDAIVKIHVDNQAAVHGYPLFFPWHRYYVLVFEQHLQAIDPSIMVPYWDWGYDSQAPEASPILSARYFGGNGQGSEKKRQRQTQHV